MKIIIIIAPSWNYILIYVCQDDEGIESPETYHWQPLESRLSGSDVAALLVSSSRICCISVTQELHPPLPHHHIPFG